MKFVALLLGLCLTTPAAAGRSDDAEVYRSEVKSVLAQRCFACHGALEQKAGLRVDTVAGMQAAGVLADGVLLARLTSEDPDVRMPPEGEPLHRHELESIAAWITAGAPAPPDEVPEADPGSHWAFQRIERPLLPSGNGNLIDVYFAAQHEARGLAPQPPAQRTLLIRRLYLDLIGLPPTPAELASAEPVPQIIEALLESPHHGERWGRHWMDVWRYSDWYGLDKMLRDSQRHLWHWREWIVTSLNEDKGYDQIVREMLAADETTPSDLEAIAATGFLARNYYLFNRTTWLDNTIEHTGKAFLGLTLNCAKCHDHKYDPIAHEDYYRFRAIFEPHHVRLDALAGETNYEVNALPRAYDDRPEAETFLHLRGDPSQPVTDRAIQPGPPAFLAAFAPAPEPVSLPVDAWAPGARPYVQQDQLAAAVDVVDKARSDLNAKLRRAEEAEEASLAEPAPAPAPGVAFRDDFQRARPERWDMVGQGWRYQGGVLAQTEVTMERSYLRTRAPHPRDFAATLTFRTTGGAQWKSTGFSFDVDGAGENGHTVYASAFAGGPKVQLAHKVSGRSIYPADAKLDRAVNLNQDYSLEVRVRDRLVNVLLDGQHLFAYNLPERQVGGALELFAFDATAEFLAIEVRELSPELALVPAKNAAAVTANDAQAVRDLAAARLAAAEADLLALKARIAADEAVYRGQPGGPPDAAGRLELLATLAHAEVDLLSADAGVVGTARKAKENAAAALAKGEFPEHSPLRGSERALDQMTHASSQYAATYPQTSTGRRTALAQWITHRDNPLTARVAVNHIWLRHFGAPLVPSVFDFGRRAPEPRHKDLLDALAMELIESGWSMRHLHRLIVSSATWQRSSSNRDAQVVTLERDPQNHDYWRMNSRRMESEVLRDSLLHLSGDLDLTLGGPSLEHAAGRRRRSLYLLHSRDDQLSFLATFNSADVFGCYRRQESIVPQQALAIMNSKLALESAERVAVSLAAGTSDDEFIRAAFRQVLARDPLEEEAAACARFLDREPNRERLIHALLNHNDFVTIR